MTSLNLCVFVVGPRRRGSVVLRALSLYNFDDKAAALQKQFEALLGHVEEKKPEIWDRQHNQQSQTSVKYLIIFFRQKNMYTLN